MDFNNLTAEEKEAIRKAVLEEEKAKEAKRKEKIKAISKHCNRRVISLWKYLKKRFLGG